MPIVPRAANAALTACAATAAFLIVKFAPAGRAHDLCVRFALLLGGFLVHAIRLMHYRPGLTTHPLLYLQHMFCVATRHGGIAIRVRTVGADTLENAVRQGGVILCTAHFGLTVAVQRALRERGIAFCAIGQPPRRDGLHWGCPARPAIIAAGPNCFLRARRALRGGQAVIAYPDRYLRRDRKKLGTYVINRNLFTFAARIRAPVLFFGAELASDRAIAIEIVRPRHSKPRDRGEANRLAEEFRDFVARRTVNPCILEARKTRLPAVPSGAVFNS